MDFSCTAKKFLRGEKKRCRQKCEKGRKRERVTKIILNNLTKKKKNKIIKKIKIIIIIIEKLKIVKTDKARSEKKKGVFRIV